jgi:hypothetical protein
MSYYRQLKNMFGMYAPAINSQVAGGYQAVQSLTEKGNRRTALRQPEGQIAFKTHLEIEQMTVVDEKQATQKRDVKSDWYLPSTKCYKKRAGWSSLVARRAPKNSLQINSFRYPDSQ